MDARSRDDGAVVVGLPSRQRSRVTNGRSLFISDSDGRSAVARRFKDILAEIVSDLGGANAGLSEGQRQIARRAAGLAVQCELIEGRAARGEELDAATLTVYGQLSDRLGRCFQRLGLKRQPRQVPDIQTYIAERIAAKAREGDA